MSRFKQPVKDNEDPIYFKYLKDTRDLTKAMDLSGEWYEAHGGYSNMINTNNYHELEHERDILEWRIKQYGMNRDDFRDEFKYFAEMIEALKKDEEGKVHRLTLEELIMHFNGIARNYSHKELYYDDPNFFDEIERRRKEQLESVFKHGKDADLDYGDPMITHTLAKRYMKRLENGEFTEEKLVAWARSKR